ncbi:MAG: sulfatase-like hydrolase/transferase [Acidobacteria bacterium]|nr:sulfatase-like hydrolase/transferase [Acidobacteriota bacterium]
MYEPHFPYRPSKPFASRWPGDPYLGEVASADAALAPLLAPIVEGGAGGRTLVVVTSDHGESLGEHGEATHGVFAYEPALKVPLVIHQPRILRPRIVDAPARHVDLLPTVLDALALPIPGGLAGRSLLPAMAGAQTDGDSSLVYFEALSGSLNRGWAPLFGVIRGGFKYIELPIPELYDLRADPHEQRNLAASDTSRVAALRAQLDELRSSEPVHAAKESAEARERLRSLGYATGSGGKPAERYSEEDDPKRLIGLDAILQEILDRYLAGDIPGALARCRELVRNRPSMALSWMQLAHLEREAGNLNPAVDAMRRAVALSAGDSEPLALLGAYLTEAGRAHEAADLLESAARQPHGDVDILTARALALARLNRIDEALAILTRARDRDPSDAMLLVHIGTVQLTGGNRAAARGAFEQALRLSPNLARAHSSLGVMALEDGHADRASEHWKAATSLDPGEHGRILALGIAFARSGRAPAARVCFEFFAAHAPRPRYARDLDRVRAWLNDAR